MPTNTEESGKACPDTQDLHPSSIPDENLDSPIVDISVSSTNSDISKFPANTKSFEVSADINSPETSPSTDPSGSKETSGGLQESEKTQPSTKGDLKVFSTKENSVSCSDATPLCEADEATVLSQSALKENKQLSDTKESNQLEVPSDVGVTNDAFALDEITEEKHDVQVGLISL
jgi:hypothetical protein